MDAAGTVRYKTDPCQRSIDVVLLDELNPNGLAWHTAGPTRFVRSEPYIPSEAVQLAAVRAIRAERRGRGLRVVA